MTRQSELMPAQLWGRWRPDASDRAVLDGRGCARRRRVLLGGASTVSGVRRRRGTARGHDDARVRALGDGAGSPPGRPPGPAWGGARTARGAPPGGRQRDAYPPRGADALRQRGRDHYSDAPHLAAECAGARSQRRGELRRHRPLAGAGGREPDRLLYAVPHAAYLCQCAGHDPRGAAERGGRHADRVAQSGGPGRRWRASRPRVSTSGSWRPWC